MRMQEAAPPPAPTPPVGPQPPAEPFAEYAPTQAEPWNAKRAGHLLRRATFGATPERLKLARERGMGQTVEDLFAFDPKTDIGGLNAFLEQAKGLYDIRRSPIYVSEWWYHRMARTPFPVQERIALFWHDHFATSAAKVGNATWMHDQIELFRTDGLGSFRDLTVNVGRQPAMLRWLDGHGSHKSNPNENYGREIMELFCLGVGNYTEADVQELARCFTGWLIQGNASQLFPDRFDETEKTIFASTEYATTGALTDEQAVDAVLKHPQAPRFIAGRLLETFVHPKPLPEHIDHYAARLVAHGWVIGPLVKEMLKSRLFYSEWAYRSRIKSPVELAIGACFATGSVPRSDFLRRQCERMGQMLLYPPNVAGWKGGDVWINANTVMVRFEFCRDLAQQGFNDVADNSTYQFLDANDLKTADKVLNTFGELMLDGQVPPAIRGRMLDYMTRDQQNEPADFVFNYNTFAQKVRGMLQLLASSPHYQLA